MSYATLRKKYHPYMSDLVFSKYEALLELGKLPIRNSHKYCFNMEKKRRTFSRCLKIRLGNANG